MIVTAQRREQSAQDVPISITVLNQQQLSNANITNSSDLATYTPSLQTNQRFGPESATFAIRGFTQALRTTASVGVYFAEVVAPRGQSAQTSARCSSSRTCRCSKARRARCSAATPPAARC
ncbi:MAG: Plug domain-containing protein [Solimonas sp.]